jgi:hypothetical protein
VSWKTIDAFDLQFTKKNKNIFSFYLAHNLREIKFSLEFYN